MAEITTLHTPGPCILFLERQPKPAKVETDRVSDDEAEEEEEEAVD